MITLNEEIMERLLKSRAYPKPAAGEVLIFGLRSYLPVSGEGTDVQPSHEIAPAELDYDHVRCTLGLWQVGQGVAVFPGSTVPKGSMVEKYSKNPWGIVNQMVPGCYASYKLGNHNGSVTHRAVRQVRAIMIRRSDDGDAHFELTDPIYVDTTGYVENGKVLGKETLVNNNIHCGFYFKGEHKIPETSYSSVGCQVVAGYTDGSQKSESGPWKKFVGMLYDKPAFKQVNYTYLLFSKEEVAAASSAAWAGVPVEVTYGSYHSAAKQVQEALQKKGFYKGDIDGDFRARSVAALLAFERAVLPKGSATGRVTSVVRDLLGLNELLAHTVTLSKTGSLQVAKVTVLPEVPAAEEISLSLDAPLVSSVGFKEDADGLNWMNDESLEARLDVSYKPLPGWRVGQGPGSNAQWYLWHDQVPAPHLYLGAAFSYPKDNPTTHGLARTSSAQPKLAFDPDAWKADFGQWPELLYPTSLAESGANFLVVNAWDKAALTVGFIQLAAHTSDDFLPFMKRLIQELPEDAHQWFPELVLHKGVLCFQQGGRVKSLEKARVPNDGVAGDSYYRGDFMQFFNPHRKLLDLEEVHATARWVEWSRTSEAMRRLQVKASIENMLDSVKKLHVALLADGTSKYPKGVDGMRCDYLAAAIAVPHLSPKKVGQAVWALKQNDVLSSFEVIEYGPGDREKTVVKGVKNRDTKLSKLRYDLAAGRPI